VPIYEYACEACGRVTEHMQKISDPPPGACPACGEGPLSKVVSRTSFHLKGGGWYADLYASKKDGTKAPAEGKPDAKAEGKADAKAEGKAEGKPDAKAEGKAEPKRESRPTPPAASPAGGGSSGSGSAGGGSPPPA